ncbi:MAG TPA: DUF3857 domain-containing protein, partial [Candidatus Angelobacter sp.]|nr:DUF3857 domain-containing protein [Candidatus Angelobacter sp.]
MAFLFLAASAWASDVWDGPAFSASPEQLRQAAAAIKAEKEMQATILLNEEHYTFDQAGRETRTRHLIYRIENEDGVKGWAESSGQWAPWFQTKPEIKARVIGLDGIEHWLDTKTLTDVPVRDEDEEVYTD